MGFALTPGEAPLHFSRSKNVMHVDGPVKHFHAEYNGHWAKYSFDGDLIKGGLPRKQERLVLAWAEIHREDLESNWKCVEAHVQPGHIEPLR